MSDDVKKTKSVVSAGNNHATIGEVMAKVGGRARLITTNKNNEVTQDTGFHANLELDNGLNALGRDGENWFTAVSVGTGKLVPSVEQTHLVNLIAKSEIKTATDNCSIAYDNTKDHYEVYAEYRYDFDDIASSADVEIKEFGLTLADDTLATRTLTKDEDGDFKPFTILQGETLSIFYGVTQRFSTDDTVSQITVSNGQGVDVDYTVKSRLMGCGLSDCYDVVNIAKSLSLSGEKDSNYSYLPHSYSSILVSLIKTTKEFTIRAKDFDVSESTLSKYVPLSFERIITLKANYDDVNIDGGIRRITIGTSMGCWQFQFDNVADGSTLDKTISKKLSIPIKFSWGRL